MKVSQPICEAVASPLLMGCIEKQLFSSASVVKQHWEQHVHFLALCSTAVMILALILGLDSAP